VVYREPFTLYPRNTRNGKKVWYYRVYNEYGERTSGRSTGQTSKAAARQYVIDLIKKGGPLRNKDITFNKYAEDWWLWESCQYIRGKLARGKTLSRSYADAMRSYLAQHILPRFGNKKLSSITPNMVEAWVMGLREKKGRTGKRLSHATINHCLKCLKLMLSEAKRRGYILVNPSEHIEMLEEKLTEKSILSIDEMKLLFHEDHIDLIWEGGLCHYTINLLSASSGMRLGEVQALLLCNVHEGYVTVQHSWNRKYGLVSPKGDSVRDIPIPNKTNRYLKNVIDLSPFTSPNDFVFWGIDRSVPVRNESILNHLYSALDKIGVSKEMRKERNITFHSWRHFYNSVMRGKIPDAKLRRLTGHRTEQMTEHYTHFQLTDFEDVVGIQDELFV
jgi:integrase